MRHAHASHALDRGAPIHLVQATLGHSSVATTSRYLHARPGDSSARFLAPERFPHESRRVDLLVSGTGVMNVLTAGKPAKGDRTEMTTTIAETQENKQVAGPAKEPKAPKKANAGPQKPPVASARGKAGEKATSGKKGRHATRKAETERNAREGSKTAKVLDLMKRPGG